ncbi:MAG: hypothetical protein ACLU0O_04155 [Collinsella sp.]
MMNICVNARSSSSSPGSKLIITSQGTLFDGSALLHLYHGFRF